MMDEEQTEWLRRHAITRCPPGPEVSIAGNGSEEDLIRDASVGFVALDPNEPKDDEAQATKVRRKAEAAARFCSSGALAHEEGNMAGMRTKHGDEMREKVRALHAEGLTDRQISERLNIARSVSAYHRKLLGLAPNHKSGAASPGPAPKAEPRAAKIPAGKGKPKATGLAGRSVVTICLSEEALDRWFCGLALDEKARIAEARFLECV